MYLLSSKKNYLDTVMIHIRGLVYYLFYKKETQEKIIFLFVIKTRAI